MHEPETRTPADRRNNPAAASVLGGFLPQERRAGADRRIGKGRPSKPKGRSEGR